jgi:hypothetical protein
VSDVKLGTLIDATAERDAIHVAIAPVVASQILAAGDHVGLLPGSLDEVAGAGPGITPIGIVDPYIEGSVNVGERFYLLLYPQTVTGMRHHWTHPAFVAVAPVPAPADDEKAASKRWIEAFASDIDQTYGRLMAAADRWVDSGDYTYDNDESYKPHYGRFEEFWRHYEIVTGVKVDDPSAFFTCSC